MPADIYMTTLYCNNKECMARVRVGRLIKLPVTRVGAFSYCPLCGGYAVSQSDSDEDYWEVLAAAHNVTVDIIRMAYDCWDRNEFVKFSDHMDAIKREVDNETATEPEPEPEPEPESTNGSILERVI